MSTKAVNLINILLIISACFLAYLLPFELFLFSYAILGPLHYLTEISWLHKHSYYTNSKNDYLVLIACTAALIIAVFVFNYHRLTTLFIFLAISFALASVTLKRSISKVIFILVATGVASLLVQKVPTGYILFGLFIPTLIHVFVFTFLFILYGTLKSKSFTGLLTIIVFIICAFSFFIYSPETNYQATDYAKNALDRTGFLSMNIWFARVFHFPEVTKATVFHSVAALQIMRFVAFAYTYHYLNWFSKTEVIKWHLVPKPQLIFVIVVWVASIGIYVYDFKIGLSALYILSISHVILEFPLNFRSMVGVSTEIKKYFPFSKARTATR